MNSERKQILQLLADGKVNVDEAERLIRAIDEPAGVDSDPSEESGGRKKKPKFLCVNVQCEPGSHHKHENVNVKIPILLLKAGVKLGSLMPEKAKGEVSSHLAEHGISLDLNKLDGDKIDELVEALTECSIDVDTDKEKVKICCA